MKESTGSAKGSTTNVTGKPVQYVTARTTNERSTASTAQASAAPGITVSSRRVTGTVTVRTAPTVALKQGRTTKK